MASFWQTSQTISHRTINWWQTECLYFSRLCDFNTIGSQTINWSHSLCSLVKSSHRSIFPLQSNCWTNCIHSWTSTIGRWMIHLLILTRSVVALLTNRCTEHIHSSRQFQTYTIGCQTINQSQINHLETAAIQTKLDPNIVHLRCSLFIHLESSLTWCLDYVWTPI